MAITSAFQADDAGSIPAARSNTFADIAQSVERTLGKGEVGSSNLPISTTSSLSHAKIFNSRFLRIILINLNRSENGKRKV